MKKAMFGIIYFMMVYTRNPKQLILAVSLTNKSFPDAASLSFITVRILFVNFERNYYPALEK